MIKRSYSLLSFIIMQKKMHFLFLFACANVLYAQPIIRFDSTVINYGTIEQGSERVRSVRMWNDATKPENPADSILNALIISSAKGSCGCIVPTYTKEPIPPGRFGVLSINYDTQRVGPFTKTVTVSCNDPKNDTHVVTVKGYVYEKDSRKSKGILTLLNPSLDAGTLKRGDTSGIFIIKIQNTGSEIFRITDTWLSNGIVIDRPYNLRPQEIGFIQFQMINSRSEFYKGERKDVLRIQTDTPFMPQGEEVFISVNRL
jgi:Protein of unknown function (DUF1573)